MKKKKTAKKITKNVPATKTIAQKKASPGRMKEIMQHYDCVYGKDYFQPTTVKCPLCKKGIIVPAKGRFGPVWRCNAEVKPRCKFNVDTKPTGKKCSFKRAGKTCGELMVAGTKTIPDRCSDKSCPNRNPHKL